MALCLLSHHPSWHGGHQACAVCLGMAALLCVGKCHNITVTDRHLSDRSVNPLPDASGKHQGKASRAHPAKNGVASNQGRAEKMPSCVSEPCMFWWHKGTKSTTMIEQCQQSQAPTALQSLATPVCLPYKKIAISAEKREEMVLVARKYLTIVGMSQQ